MIWRLYFKRERLKGRESYLTGASLCFAGRKTLIARKLALE